MIRLRFGKYRLTFHRRLLGGALLLSVARDGDSGNVLLRVSRRPFGNSGRVAVYR